MKEVLLKLRRYFLADDDEEIEPIEYVWLVGGYGTPVAITIFTVIATL